MQSNRSLFNPSIYKQHLKNYWWISAAATAFLLLVMPFGFYLNNSTLSRSTLEMAPLGQGCSPITENLIGFLGNWILVFIFILAIVMVTAVFSYLSSNRSAFMIHTFPVTRKSLFISGTAAALTLEIIPFVVTGIAMYLVAAALGAELVWIGIWMLYALVGVLFFTAVALFTVMTTAQIWTCFVFYGIYNFMVMAICMLVNGLYGMISFGTGYNLRYVDNCLMPIVYMIEHSGLSIGGESIGVNQYRTFVQFEGAGLMAAYAATAVVIAVVAYIFYKKRKMETTGEFITVSFLKPVFRLCMSFFVATAAAILIVSIVSGYSELMLRRNFVVAVFSMIVIGFLVYMASEMLIRKTFRVFNKEVFRGFGIYAVLAVVIVLALHFDVFGVERRVPKTEDVAKVVIRDNNTVLADTPEEIELVREAHQAVLDSKSEILDHASEDYYNTLSIEYTLKNGHTLSRRYMIPMAYWDPWNPELKDKILGAIGDPEMNLKGELVKDYEDLTVYSIEVNGGTEHVITEQEFNEGWYTDAPGTVISTYTSADLNLTTDELKGFYEALLRDAKDGNLYGTDYWNAWYERQEDQYTDDADDNYLMFNLSFNPIVQKLADGTTYNRNPYLTILYTENLKNIHDYLQKIGIDPRAELEESGSMARG